MPASAISWVNPVLNWVMSPVITPRQKTTRSVATFEYAFLVCSFCKSLNFFDVKLILISQLVDSVGCV